MSISNFIWNKSIVLVVVLFSSLSIWASTSTPAVLIWSSANPVVSGSSLSFTAQVLPRSPAATGSISFIDSGTTLGSGTLSPVSITNLLPYSQTPTSWGAVNRGTVSGNTVIAPDGTQTAGTLTANSNATDSWFDNFVFNPSSYSGGTVTASVWLRVPSGSAKIELAIAEAGSQGSVPATAQMVTLTTTWQRFVVTSTLQSSLTSLCLQIGGGGLFNSGMVVNVWGAQMVTGSSGPGPYVVTGSSSATGTGTVATFTTSTLSPGGHSITASYSGNSNYNPATSPVLSQSVQSPVLTLSSSVNPSSYGQPATFSGLISTGGTLPSGTVTFYDGSTAIGTGSILSSGTVTNILPFSQSLNFWYVNQGTMVGNAITAPDGTQTAGTMTANSDATDAWSNVGAYNPSAYNGATVTASVWLRVLSGTATINICISEVGSQGLAAPAAQIVTLTTTWQRFVLTGTLQSGLTNLVIQIGGGGSFTNGLAVNVWGGQMVVGSSGPGAYVANGGVLPISGVGGIATLSPSLTAGTHSITASYAGGVSQPLTQTVSQAAEATLNVTGVPTLAQPYNATFTVGSSGGSGTGAVTFAASGACSVSSTTVTMTSSAGTCSVTATKASDGNYASATSAVASVAAKVATETALTVTGVPTAAQAYGATFTVGSTGGSGSGAMSFTGTGACSASGTTVTMTSGTGTCSVTATKASDGNYASATSVTSAVAASLVAQATLTVTDVPGTAQPYGATFTVASTGGSGTGAVSFTGTGACSASGTTITMTSGTGTCSVTATKASDGNYASATSVTSAVAASLVAQATLTVAGVPGTAQPYGATFTVASTGGSGTGAVSFTGTGACSASGTTITMTSSTGTCSATATKAADSNYSSTTSAASTIGATTATQTITFGALANVTYGVSPITLAAIASSGLPVSYEVAGPATVAGSTLTITGIGTVMISANQAGTTNYAAATPVSQSFQVSPEINLPGAGNISTVAGNGNPYYSGDGGAATSATLWNPQGVAADLNGNLYIADSLNSLIRKVSTLTGTISTVAGGGTLGYTVNGVPATSAILNFPRNLAVDFSGNLFITDYDDNCVREVLASTGIITTIAGTGTRGFSGDYGPAVSAELNSPTGVAVDSAGNVYIADNFRVRMITMSTGIITTVAGNGWTGYSGDGGAATSAMLNDPHGVAVDSSGNLYIADTFNDSIRMVTSSTKVISTVAGTGIQGYSGDGGAATSAKLFQPYGVTVDSDGNFYISDISNYVVRKVTAATGIIAMIAGNRTEGYSGDGGPATSAHMSQPYGVAVDTHGNLYIADADNNRIRAVGTIKASQTINFPNPGPQTYGVAPITLNAAASSGLPVNYTVMPGSPASVIGNKLTITGAGEATVVATQAGDPDYSAAQPVSQSLTVVVNPAFQTITFANPGTQNYGTPLTLNAIASSDLPVSYVVTSGPAAVNLNILTFTGTGTVTVQANQPGNPYYQPATPISQSFTVDPPLPVITGLSPSAGLGGSLVTITGTNFGTSPGTLVFGGPSAAIVSWSSNSITAWVPSASTPNELVAVMIVAGGQSSNAVGFSVTGLPTPNPTCQVTP